MKSFILSLFLIIFTIVLNAQWATVTGDYQMCSNQLSVRDGQIALGDDSRPYFIGTDNRIHNLWWNGSSWQDGYLNSSAPTAKSGSGLAFAKYLFPGGTDYGDYLYYTNSSGLLYWLKYSSGWIYASGGSYVLNNSVMATNSSNQIEFIYSNGAVCIYSNDVDAKGQALYPMNSTSSYYVGPDSKVHYTYFTSGIGYRNYIVNANASLVMANTEITYGDYWVFYVGTDGKVRNLSCSNSWILNSSAPTVAQNTGLLWAGDRLFYVDNNHRLRYLRWDGSTWALSGIIGQQVKANTKLAYKNNRLFYVSSTGAIRYFYWTNKSGNINDENIDFINRDIVDVKIFPNPANEYFSISTLDCQKGDIYIYDIQGKHVKSILEYDLSQVVAINDLKSGMYIIKIITDNYTINKKLNIKR